MTLEFDQLQFVITILKYIFTGTHFQLTQPSTNTNTASTPTASSSSSSSSLFMISTSINGTSSEIYKELSSTLTSYGYIYNYLCGVKNINTISLLLGTKYNIK